MLTPKYARTQQIKLTKQKHAIVIGSIFLLGFTMYAFVISIAQRDARDVEFERVVLGDFQSRESFEKQSLLKKRDWEGHGTLNRRFKDEEEEEEEERRIDSYHEEIEAVELKRKNEELLKLRQRVQESERMRTIAEQRLKEIEEQKKIESGASRSENMDAIVIEEKKKTSKSSEGGFYEKDGLDALAWAKARDSETKESYEECHMIENSEYWGTKPISVNGVSSNDGSNNKKENWKRCCESCKEESECNAWRFDPRNRNCLLGKNKNIWQPPTYGKGDAIPYTSGMLHPEPVKYDPVEANSESATCITTMITSNGGAYMNWQTRLVYASWKNVAMKHDKAGIMTRFTRVLHRTKDDELVGIVPTWRAEPWHPDCDNSCSYSVKDRARAIYDWSQSEDAKKCSHVLMAEADYIFVAAPPPSVLLAPGHSYGFLFGYIIPSHPDAMPASKVFHKGFEDKIKYDDVPQTGNAPQIMYTKDLTRVAERWKELMVVSESDETVQRIFGWVRDMYAFSFAAAQIEPPIQFRLPPVPFSDTMVQIPADVQLGKAIAMHYTWGPQIKIGPKPSTDIVWQFDKRRWGGAGRPGKKFEKIQMTPKWDKSKDYRLNADEVLQETQLDVLRIFVEYFNDAVDMANSVSDIAGGGLR